MSYIKPVQTETNPFLITGPATVSFSGGETSGYMLAQIVKAHGGVLPHDVIVAFENTGREMEAALRFVRDVSAWLGVYVHWLEYRFSPDRGHHYEHVSFDSASRNGEPFDQIIQARGFLPNTRQVFCSGEMKTRTLHRYIKAEFGWTEWKQVVGLRADRPDDKRVLKARERAKSDREYRGVTFPLYDAGVTKADVKAFWADKPIRLQHKGAWEGNCDGCVRKRRSAIARMFRDYPERMDWWAQWEAAMAGKTRSPDGAKFRKDYRGGYAGVRDLEFAQGRLDLDPDDDGVDVMIECDGPIGCGI